MANSTYEIHANNGAGEANMAQFKIDRTYPARWTITFRQRTDQHVSPHDDR
jgi:hypothetical protein